MHAGDVFGLSVKKLEGEYRGKRGDCQANLIWDHKILLSQQQLLHFHSFKYLQILL